MTLESRGRTLRVVRLAIFVLTMATASTAAAGTDVFQKWQTPSGTLYIGDRPPSGSVLLEKIELTSADASAASPIGLSDAARDGREIMKLRAAERESQRERELKRDLGAGQLTQPEVIYPLVVVGSAGFGHHRRHGRRFEPRLGVGPSPVSAVERLRFQPFTPDISAMARGSLFSRQSAHAHRGPR